MNDLVTVIPSGQAVTTSRKVAENFSKDHKHVLDSIREIVGYAENSSTPMFFETTYIHPQNKQEYPEFLMNRDGFTLLAMGFTGSEAMQWKIKYIQAFNEMEKQVAPASIEDLIILQAQSMKDVKLQLAQQGEQIKQLTAKMETSPSEYFTVAGYASVRGIKVDIGKANLLGRKAAKLSQEYSVDVGKVSDPRFGRVNTYHTDILKEVFA